MNVDHPPHPKTHESPGPADAANTAKISETILLSEQREAVMFQNMMAMKQQLEELKQGSTRPLSPE